MEKFDRIMEITNRYWERFGRASIEIYYLPPLAENCKLQQFLSEVSPCRSYHLPPPFAKSPESTLTDK